MVYERIDIRMTKSDRRVKDSIEDKADEGLYTKKNILTLLNRFRKEEEMEITTTSLNSAIKNTNIIGDSEKVKRIKIRGQRETNFYTKKGVSDILMYCRGEGLLRDYTKDKVFEELGKITSGI